MGKLSYQIRFGSCVCQETIVVMVVIKRVNQTAIVRS
jgi:hypothetical protein